MASFPSTAAPSLSNWQWSVGGLTLGPSTPYAISNVDGFGMPGLQTGDAQKPRDQGEFTGYDYLQGRDITLAGDIVTDGTSLAHSITALAQVTTPTTAQANTEYPLWFKVPNIGTIASMVRCRHRDLPLNLQFVAGLASINLQFHATDPAWYSQASTVSAGITAGAATVSIVNSGNYSTRPTLRVSGPLASGWTISNGTSVLIVNFGFLAGAGIYCDIDLDLHTITYTTSGTSVNIRYALGVNPGWFECAAGTSSITLAGSATSGATQLSATYSSAWVF